MPLLGSIVCTLTSEIVDFFWNLLYTVVAAPGMCLLSHRVLLKCGRDASGYSSYIGLVVVALLLASFNPILYACVFLYLSLEFGKLVTMVLLLSMEDYRRLLAHFEYRMDQRDGSIDDLGMEWSQSLSLAQLEASSQLVRCPLCRRLSLSSQVVRKVHGDIRREPCCVCLACDSEVCFGCGHLCMCSSCFDGLLEQRQPVPDSTLVTTYGMRDEEQL